MLNKDANTINKYIGNFIYNFIFEFGIRSHASIFYRKFSFISLINYENVQYDNKLNLKDRKKTCIQSFIFLKE